MQALVDRVTHELEALQAEKVARLAAVDQERERTTAHLRAVEDRAHQEIDRARQETKQWQHRHAAAEQTYREAVQTQGARSEALQKQLQQAEKEVARLSGHVAALETSLANASARPKTKRARRSVSAETTRSRKPKQG